MRNADHDDVRIPAGEQTSRRRRKILAGAAGLAAVLGGATVAASQWGGNDDPAVLVEAADPTSEPASTSTASPQAGSSGGAHTTPQPKVSAASAGSPPSLPADAAKRIAEARAAAAKDSVPLLRPLPQGTVAEVPDEAVTVRNSGSVQKDKATLRLVSARADLTGQRELAWVADGGRKVGDSRCSQTIKLANNTKPERKSTLLICWRTSAKKSVYTVAVDLDGDPSEQRSVAAINAEWKKLG